MILDLRVIKILKGLGFPGSKSEGIKFGSVGLYRKYSEFDVGTTPKCLRVYEHHEDFAVCWEIVLDDDLVLKFKNKDWFAVDGVEDFILKLFQILDYKTESTVHRLKNLITLHKSIIEETRISIGYEFQPLTKFLKKDEPLFNRGDVLFEDLGKPLTVTGISGGYYHIDGGRTILISSVHLASLPVGARIVTDQLEIGIIEKKQFDNLVDGKLLENIVFTLNTGAYVSLNSVLGVISWGPGSRSRKVRDVII